MFAVEASARLGMPEPPLFSKVGLPFGDPSLHPALIHSFLEWKTSIPLLGARPGAQCRGINTATDLPFTSSLVFLSRASQQLQAGLWSCLGAVGHPSRKQQPRAARQTLCSKAK